jgi:AcrR family transcriptional regulator
MAKSEVNFRVRVARERRERMQALLLGATLKVCAVEKGRGPAVIDDVIKEAGVSRGTFYKYFDSLEEALAQVGVNLVNEAIGSLQAMFAGVDDPLHRSASGIQLMMIHSIVDPVWARFVVHMPHFASASVLISAIEENTVAGRKRGDFQFESLKAAVDFQLAATLEAIQRLLVPMQGRKAYMRDMALLTLRGLGVSNERSQRAIAASLKDIHERGPTALPWWQPY